MNEGDKFLKDNPDIRAVDALFADVNGILRGKRIAPETLPKIFDSGFQIPASTAMLDVTGDDGDPLGLSITEGDPDIAARPIPGTLVSVPWAKKPLAQVLVSLFEKNDTPFTYDPRHILASVISRFDELGLNPVVALEQEFYLLDQDGAREGLLKAPVMPTTGKRATSMQVLSISDIDGFGEFLDHVSTACSEQNIPVGPISSEYAVGQYEINLIHTDDLLAAADQATLLPRIVKGVAALHNLEATFMAKPYLHQSGSGMHIHASLIDKDGKNVFANGQETGSPLLGHVVGGLLATMPESMSIFAPNVNSYRRFIPDTYVPVNRSWGVNNRSVAVRIPGGDDHNRRIEHRVAGADANPYLSLAALLAGMHYGLKHKISPPEISTGNACLTADPGLPTQWPTALDCLSEGEILKDYLGEDYCNLYVSAKKTEMESFFSTPSQKEFEWYLRPDC
jgi:glutamine synthetase